MTSPLSPSLVAKLKNATAWWFDGEAGEGTFTFRFFCCTDPNDLGLDPGKEPVAVIELSPNPTFPGDTVSFDGTDSYDPDGSIAAYSWVFPGQTPASSSASSGTITAGSPGTYTVSLVVTDGTSLKSSPAEVTLVVADRIVTSLILLCTESGLFVSEDGGDSWLGLNDGLTIYELETFDAAVDPATQRQPLEAKTIWRTGNGLILASVDGGDTWHDVTPSTIGNQWGDSPAPTPSQLKFDNLLFVDGGLFVSATWNNGGSYRSWVLHTDSLADFRGDQLATISWTELVTTWDE